MSLYFETKYILNAVWDCVTKKQKYKYFWKNTKKHEKSDFACFKKRTIFSDNLMASNTDLNMCKKHEKTSTFLHDACFWVLTFYGGLRKPWKRQIACVGLFLHILVLDHFGPKSWEYYGGGTLPVTLSRWLI